MFFERSFRTSCLITALATWAVSHGPPTRGQDNPVYQDEFVLHSLTLQPNQEFWLTIAGSNLVTVDFETRESESQRPHLSSEKWLERFTDFENAERLGRTFHVYHGNVPQAVPRTLTDLSVRATGDRDRVAQITQCGVSKGTEAFIHELGRASMARDQVVAVPSRFYAAEAEGVLISLYTEVPGCSQLRITDRHDSIVHQHGWDYTIERPSILPWFGHNEVEPGRYQVSVLIRYTENCHELEPTDGADFVLYGSFVILPPR